MPYLHNNTRDILCVKTKPFALYITAGNKIRITEEQAADGAILDALTKGTVTLIGGDKNSEELKNEVINDKIDRKPKTNRKIKKKPTR